MISLGINLWNKVSTAPAVRALILNAYSSWLGGRVRSSYSDIWYDNEYDVTDGKFYDIPIDTNYIGHTITQANTPGEVIVTNNIVISNQHTSFTGHVVGADIDLFHMTCTSYNSTPAPDESNYAAFEWYGGSSGTYNLNEFYSNTLTSIGDLDHPINITNFSFVGNGSWYDGGGGHGGGGHGGGEAGWTGNLGVSNITMPNLQSLVGDNYFAITSCAGLTSVALPALTQIGGPDVNASYSTGPAVNFVANPFLTTINFDALSTIVYSYFVCHNNRVIEYLNLDSLETIVASGINLSTNPLLTNLSLPSLIRIDQSSIDAASGGSLTSVSIPNLEVFATYSSISLQGNNMNTAAMNSLLLQLSASLPTGDSTSTIDLSYQQTSEQPTETGAIADLASKGYTIIT